MKKGFLKRALALVVCAAVSVTSMPATAFAEGMESAETLDIETQEETVQTYESVEPTTESETESETDTESVESQESTETVESEETTTESVEEDTEPPVEITEKTGQIKVSWKDESDLSKRRSAEEHPESFLTVYADGEKMEVQPEMELESPMPEETEEAQIYTYNIKKLPVMQEDGITPVTYTVKEEVPAGYEKTLEEIKLVSGDDETKLEGEKTFENTLPAYQVSGSISWKTTSEDAVHPEMEAYFANQFIIVRQGDGEKYETYKIDYAQDDEDSEKWNYSVKGLFTTSADGSQAFYRIQPTAVEGFLSQAEGIDINGDTETAEFIYSESQSNSDTPMLFAAGRAATVVPSAYEDKPINIFWLDNTDTHPAVTLEAKFTIGQNTYTYNKENALTYLGITADRYKDFAKQQGAGTYDAYLLNVPTKVAVGDAPAVDVTWELNQTATAGTNYLRPEYKDTQDGYSNVWINREKDNSSFIVDVKDGITDRDVEAFAAEIHLWGKVGASTIDFGPLSGLTNKVLNSTDYPVEYDKDGAANGDGTYTVKLNNLPEFTDDKVEIIYYLQATGDKLIEDKDSGDYYKPSYDNKNSTNFGSNITECHDGGSLILTIMGKTDYSATKVWLDDGTVERPDSTLYLWRYTIKGGGSSYKEAAQVTDAANNNISISVGKASNIVPCKLENLDKYDPEGYQYRYLTLESLSGTNAGIYEQVHLQSYTEYPENSGTVTDIVEQDRNDDPGDRSIYDDEIIANRITGQTTVAWKKIWKAAHYQDDLSKVEVTLGLQQREKSTTARADAAWTDTTTTQTIDNFIAENLIQGGSVSVSQYSELGIPLEYQWVEKEIEEDGVGVAIDKDGRFELSHNKAPENLSKNGKDDEYYTSTVETTIQEDGTSLTTVTNQLKGTTTYTVDKLWAQLDDNGDVLTDGEGHTIYGKTAPANASVVMDLYRDDVTPFTWTKKDKKQGTSNVTLDADDNFFYEYTDLPKYDEDGMKYTYVVNEASSTPNWYSGVAYDVTDENDNYFDCQLKNAPVGPGKSIWIRKEWLDDGDEPNRRPVQIALYRKKQGNETSDHYFGTYTLTSAQNWRAQLDISEYDTDKNLLYGELGNDQYYIREVGIGTGSSAEYDVYNSGAAYTESTGGAPNRVNGTSATIDRITGADSSYIYEAYYGVGEKGELQVTNRRIGTVNVKVDKTWLDGNNENNNRPSNVVLVLKTDGDDGYSDTHR